MSILRIAMAQINPIVGDISGNTKLITSWLKEARKAKADLVVFPELAVTGYPPEDLLLKPKFVAENVRALTEIARKTNDTAAIVGYVGHRKSNKIPLSSSSVVSGDRRQLFNAAAILAGGRIVGSYAKWLLPNYGVFDEGRYFHPGRLASLLELRGVLIGVNICEDIWYQDGPTKVQAEAGAKVIVNINASPFHIGKSRVREQMLATRARENGVIVTYTNTVGGQDELVFDGNSVVLDQGGTVIARAKAFEEDLLVADLKVEGVIPKRAVQGRKKATGRKLSSLIQRVSLKSLSRRYDRGLIATPLSSLSGELDEVYRALVLGVRDYTVKNGFKQVVIGLSGGVDSALTAVIAVDALGFDNVLGIFMPSPYTSKESRGDVIDLVERLGIQCRTIPITSTFQSYLTSLAESFKGKSADTTEENLQARIRGNILMAFSNKFGHLVLTTGNKSEMSVGYATLYGDMAGGFAVIKDVPKTMVYELSHFRNARGSSPVIPKRILDRAPTAELRPNQKDEDSLPPYPILDPILKAYVEEDRSLEEIVGMGFSRAVVSKVIGMVDRSEYKRRQAPIGIKITHRAFGKDRRMPVTNGYSNC
ncbi:NAD+ synthase [Petrachloros mirabilis]